MTELQLKKTDSGGLGGKLGVVSVVDEGRPIAAPTVPRCTYNVNDVGVAIDVESLADQAVIHPRKISWTVKELQEAEFPEPQWAVPDVLPVGLTILAGRPKVGKSWLALSIASAVGTGGRLFDRQVQRGEVFYLALEDSPRRLRDRMRRQGTPGTAAIEFVLEWPAFDAGGVDKLQDVIDQGRYRLVVIDTMTRAMGRADQRDAAIMTECLGGLQRSALGQDVALLVIDHHRKPSGYAADPIDDILESTSKPGVADLAMGLYRESGHKSATLRGRGRDLEDIELALEFDPITCCWQSLGDADTVRADSVKGEVLQTIRDLIAGGEVATNAGVAEATGRDKALINRTVSDLVRLGEVVRMPRVGRLVPLEIPKRMP